MMASRGGDSYSRLISWLKVLLPLLALAVLSTLFLLSRTINPDDAIPYAEVDVDARMREQRMTTPTYSSMTRDGASIVIDAAEVRPGQEGAASSGTAVVGTMTARDGVRTDMVADTAVMAGDGDLLTLTGNVSVTHAQDFNVKSAEMTAALDHTEVRSAVPVVATSPFGTITADTMALTADAATGDSHLLVFNGNVKLIYQPAK
jgi:lipopolysaccharide export system protein LptC